MNVQNASGRCRNAFNTKRTSKNIQHGIHATLPQAHEVHPHSCNDSAKQDLALPPLTPAPAPSPSPEAHTHRLFLPAPRAEPEIPTPRTIKRYSPKSVGDAVRTIFCRRERLYLSSGEKKTRCQVISSFHQFPLTAGSYTKAEC